LDGVNVKQSLGSRDEAEVDGVRHRPHSPGSLHARPEVVLDVIDDGSSPQSSCDSVVAKEHAAKDRVPDDLVNKNLAGNGERRRAWDLGVKEVVEVVASGPVDKESKHGQAQHLNRNGGNQSFCSTLL
jgi:hypothetical protein